MYMEHNFVQLIYLLSEKNILICFVFLKIYMKMILNESDIHAVQFGAR